MRESISDQPPTHPIPQTSPAPSGPVGLQHTELTPRPDSPGPAGSVVTPDRQLVARPGLSSRADAVPGSERSPASGKTDVQRWLSITRTAGRFVAKVEGQSAAEPAESSEPTGGSGGEASTVPQTDAPDGPRHAASGGNSYLGDSPDDSARAEPKALYKPRHGGDAPAQSDEAPTAAEAPRPDPAAEAASRLELNRLLDDSQVPRINEFTPPSLPPGRSVAVMPVVGEHDMAVRGRMLMPPTTTSGLAQVDRFVRGLGEQGAEILGAQNMRVDALDEWQAKFPERYAHRTAPVFENRLAFAVDQPETPLAQPTHEYRPVLVPEMRAFRDAFLDDLRTAGYTDTGIAIEVALNTTPGPAVHIGPDQNRYQNRQGIPVRREVRIVRRDLQPAEPQG